MKKIRLIDACFPQTSSSIAGDNSERHPSNFEWCRTDPCDSLNTFYTNWTLKDALTDNKPSRVAWLLEPPALWTWPYEFVAKNRKAFMSILTYDQRLLSSGDTRFKFCPHGGSWVGWDSWNVYPKTKDVCMIMSDKNITVGQTLRHEIYDEMGNMIDFYGTGVDRPFDRVFDVLKDYRYCVVVESISMDHYFTEKLIDPLSVGTIPIYWGCPSIVDFFDRAGILAFQNTEQLFRMIEVIKKAEGADYDARRQVIELNLERAMTFRMAEDWAYNEYPELFT